MTKPVATYPDVERAVCDLLDDLIEPHEPTVTVGVGVPDDWTVESAEHLQVACDGTPDVTHPVIAHATVRVTAWSPSPSRSKQLVQLALALLAAHDGTDPVAVIRVLTGVLPARDAATRAELASVTVRASVRSVPV